MTARLTATASKADGLDHHPDMEYSVEAAAGLQRDARRPARVPARLDDRFLRFLPTMLRT